MSRDTIADFELGIRHPNSNNLDALRAALEAAGVVFLAEDGDDGAWVRLSLSRKKPRR